jgi:hypothetical protein
LVLLLGPWRMAHALDQALTIHAGADKLSVTASGFGFIDGDVLDRLRDGTSVRVDLELTALTRPHDGPIAESRQGFRLSFDLWEERVAATQIATPAQSVSHLRPADAESWCLQRLTLPVAALERRGRAPFWLRLEARIADERADGDLEKPRGFTLRSLIDRLSRREDAEQRKTLEAGPFQLTS